MEHRLFLVYGEYGPVAEAYSRERSHSYMMCGSYGPEANASRKKAFQSAFDLLKQKAMPERHDHDILVTGEFLFTLEDVLRESQQFSDLAGLLDSDVIVTPANRICGSDQERDVINSRAGELGFTNSDASVEDKYNPQAVCFIFGRDGLRHTVIKSLDEMKGQGVHSVPGRDYGISICYELWQNQMDPELLKDMSLVIHPAREADFIQTKARNLYLAGVPKENIREQIRCSMPKEIENRIDMLFGHNKDILRELGIPVVSANLREDATGIIHMPDGWEVGRLEYTESHMSLILRKTTERTVPDRSPG